ncbi:MAG: chemotaxis protein [Hyphomicrobiales bacterium]|nr:chemotaxis protein [Hyphomicrobiales bacterium]
MALVKKNAIGSKTAATGSKARASAGVALSPQADERRTAPAQKQKRLTTAAERIGAATHELASGVTEAASAAEELRRSLEQIAAAADEAARSSDASLGAITSLSRTFAQARDRALAARGRTETTQSSLSDAARSVETTIANVNANSQRQIAATETIANLRTQASNVGEISRGVADVADQTTLLALNAAIEAARAGETGRGFAVVADQVRFLAEESEQKSRDVQDLAARIGADVQSVVEKIRSSAALGAQEASAAATVSTDLADIRALLSSLLQTSDDVLKAAEQVSTATREAQQGAQSIASAAEEQAAAAAQAQRSVQQQSVALDQSRRAVETLAELAARFGSGRRELAAIEEMSAAAEEMSATIQELSAASGEIRTAIGQISRGADAQASATHQASAAMKQIETISQRIGETARSAVAEVEGARTRFDRNREAIRRLTEGVATAFNETGRILAQFEPLEDSASRIDRIVDAIALIAVQTTMLAVTGSVEAARAGDAGGGFAVVSGDIRTLSRTASSNAERVKELIGAIRRQIGAARRDVDIIVAALQSEIELNRALDARLGEIAELMVRVMDDIVETSNSAAAALIAAEDVSAGTMQAAAAAQETSSAVGQAATAAEQQARGAEDLAAAIEDIASLAEVLQNETA